jgi:hypothetical protein
MGFLKGELPFADRLRKILADIFQFIGGILKVPRYFGFLLSRSRGNYVFFTVTVILILIILISIFGWLGNYNEKKLVNFEQQIESLK